MGEYTCTLPQKVYYDNELPILTRPSFRKRFHEYFNASICTDVVLEAELLVLSFITGIEDIAAFNDFHVFTSNHTGNTILLGVGASGIASSFTALPYVGISFSMFILGCWIFGRLGNSVGCRKRWWMIATNVFQTVLVFAAAGLRSWGTFSETLQGYQLPPTATSLGVLVLLAISSGAQVAMARSLQVVEITTANATSVYVDLFMDRNLFRLHNRARNRRALFVLSLSAGSCAGAFAYRNVGAANTLLITALGKVAVTLAMFYNKGFAYEERKGSQLRLQHANKAFNYGSQEQFSEYNLYNSLRSISAEGMFVDFGQTEVDLLAYKPRVHVYADLNLWDLIVSYTK